MAATSASPGFTLYTPPLLDERAVYACRPNQSRGRLIVEEESLTRTVFQRDRDRILHSGAFRAMKYKTQVFVYHEGDQFRTRLTHSLEVAQIARSISRALGLCEDLAEAVALAHDLGHPPFGHAGEDALGIAMQGFDGFDHNEQTLRVLTRLEHCYAAFDGLNLTWETLEGIAKHNGPLTGPNARCNSQGQQKPVPPYITAYTSQHDLEIDGFSGLEAQIAALADDIAYLNHDLEDGLRLDVLVLEDVTQVPLVDATFKELRQIYPGIKRERLIPEAKRRLIDRMVEDLLNETKRRLKKLAPNSAQAIRQANGPIAAFSEPMAANIKELRAYLFDHMYKHYRVNRMTSKARRIVSDLFNLLLMEPDCLPDMWRQAAGDPKSPNCARVVADYIASMTDRHARQEHSDLFNTSV